jgi:hypothetical protein
MKVYESQYKEVHFYPETQLLEEVWYEKSKLMREHEFKEEMLVYVDLLKKHQPQGVLVNSQKLLFTIAPSVQTWMAEQVFVVYPSVGMRYKAFVMSEEFFTHVSLEQHLEEDRTNYFSSKTFETREAALAWLEAKLAA